MKIIAETASNHMGELKYLKDLTFESIQNGADYVTVQVFDLNEFVTPFDKGSFENFSKVFIPKNDWLDYFSWCVGKNINVIPCLLDEKSIGLALEANFRTVKIHSSDILNFEFLKKINFNFDKVFLEFGGATIEEINIAVNVFNKARLILVYGFNDYPTKLENQNLNFIQTLTNLFNVEVGFADHSDFGEIISLMAMAKGASYLEKHVTLARNNSDRFDWQVSIEPKEIKSLKDHIDRFYNSLGFPIREVSMNERKFRKLAYKKIVVNRDMKLGEQIKMGDLAFKRSVDGLEITEFVFFLGKYLQKDLKKNDILTRAAVYNAE